ncbi:Aste57867_20795 [Aphanomyces stellatus]|uniref:Aste57867_20795 protein n=1 Tax=Aphanomyces stellatus TaxID=120398 RepID=A0A485LGI7_9STRA|nr:hypothetical protein As57867_020727 [Aphanomyces stellatus]VFT97474.1 Aste57867_20795 [Aphanomyces stellatus]
MNSSATNAADARESSDFVARFKALHDMSATPPAESYPLLPPPTAVLNRLDRTKIQWSDLPVFAQLALLWDSGYVQAQRGNASTTYLQVWVRRTFTMASIMPSFNSSRDIAPLISYYTVACNNLTSRSGSIDVPSLNASAKCAIALGNNSIATSNASMWAQDATSSSYVPILRVLASTQATQGVLSIHASNTNEPDAATCPPSASSSLVIPCLLYVPGTSSVDFAPAVGSAAMDAWLLQLGASLNTTNASTTTAPTSAAAPSQTNTATFWGAGAGLLVVLVVLAAFVKWKHKPQPPRLQLSDSFLDVATPRPPTRKRGSTADESTRPTANSTVLFADYATIDPTAALRILASVPPSLRLAADAVSCDELLATSAAADIYYGFCRHRPVAVKVLNKNATAATAAAFAEDICLLATIDHPRIVGLVGYTWNDRTIGSLAAVAPYVAQGTLSTFLNDNPHLHWSVKAALALDIAHALLYLHRTLGVAHRNLHSANVLMVWPHAHLSGFGLSTESRMDLHAAPEVLRGHRTDDGMAADMYSLGCLLCVMDTQEPLFAALEMPANRLLHRIARDGLRPMWTDECPLAIRAVIDNCLAFDPTLRPSATDVVVQLDAFLHAQEDISMFI